MTDRVYTEHGIGDAPMLKAGRRFAEYTLGEMMCSGGFGQVYLAKRGNYDTCVIKVESSGASFKLLYNECTCLKSLNMAYNVNGCEKSPFIQYHGYGANFDFSWLAMEQCGKNMNALRSAMPLNRFSTCTSLFVLYKYIDALEKMHRIGWLHRDVKPANVCIGLDDPRHLYLLDFGMSRVYVETDGTVKERRRHAPFRGTMRYVSSNIHRRQDASRWDDLWCAFYIATENMTGNLPWRRLDPKAVEQCKDHYNLALLNYGPERLRPVCMDTLEAYLKKSQTQWHYFYNQPPYELFLNDIRNELRSRGYSLSNVPLDWMSEHAPPTRKYQMTNAYQNYSSPAKNVNKSPAKKVREEFTEQRYQRSVCFY